MVSVPDKLKHKNLLQVNALTIQITHNATTYNVVENVSFSIKPQETLAILGESGSGKSLTALSLLGLLPPQARQSTGDISLNGVLIGNNFNSVRGKQIAMIFQEPMAALNPVFKVGVQINDVIKSHFKMSSKTAKFSILRLFDQVGFENPEWVYRAYPHQLSGGMAQRVMIAMALSCKPQLIIADEPTTALDVTTQAQIIDLLTHLQKQHKFALLLISHDIGVISQLADRIIVMQNGHIVEHGSKDNLLINPQHIYTKNLINAAIAISHYDETSTCKNESDYSKSVI